MQKFTLVLPPNLPKTHQHTSPIHQTSRETSNPQRQKWTDQLFYEAEAVRSVVELENWSSSIFHDDPFARQSESVSLLDKKICSQGTADV